MSRRAIRTESSASPFASHLQDVAAIAVEAAGGARNSRLGRTAAWLEQARLAAVEEGRQKGYDEGFLEGQATGYRDVAERCRMHIESFGNALKESSNQVERAMEEWYERSEQKLSELAVVIASQVVRQELDIRPEAVLPIVREALREIALADKVRIRINPFQAEVVREHELELLSLAPTVERLEITSDPSIEGGCVIESDAGAIDARLRTKFELTMSAIKEAA
ncbi:MAG: hypothetical protein HZC36_16395 [Armatimonadetes bacterium]|nr:hypothetical protein [Armatimonadota bacterium]